MKKYARIWKKEEKLLEWIKQMNVSYIVFVLERAYMGMDKSKKIKRRKISDVELFNEIRSES